MKFCSFYGVDSESRLLSLGFALAGVASAAACANASCIAQDMDKARLCTPLIVDNATARQAHGLVRRLRIVWWLPTRARCWRALVCTPLPATRLAEEQPDARTTTPRETTPSRDLPPMPGALHSRAGGPVWATVC